MWYTLYTLVGGIGAFLSKKPSFTGEFVLTIHMWDVSVAVFFSKVGATFVYLIKFPWVAKQSCFVRYLVVVAVSGDWGQGSNESKNTHSR